MAADYPGSLPSFAGQVGSAADPLSSPSLPVWATNVSDEVVAVATELGTSPSGAFSTVKARLEDIESDVSGLGGDVGTLQSDLGGVQSDVGVLQGQIGGVAPAGSMLMFGGAAAPSGWLMCDGAAVSRATYDVLFAAIGTAFGVGDGSTTFNLPDLRDRVPVGVGVDAATDTLAKVGGATEHTLTQAEMPAHSHTTPNHSHSFSATTGGNGAHTHSVASPGYIRITANPDASIRTDSPAAAGAGNRQYITQTALADPGNHTHSVSGTSGNASPTTNGTGGGDPHNNMQPFVALNFIIKI